MSKNHTSKQETVDEAIRDIAHHEHNFALADNSTNHIGDLRGLWHPLSSGNFILCHLV